jgi:hypothetical protein
LLGTQSPVRSLFPECGLPQDRGREVGRSANVEAAAISQVRHSGGSRNPVLPTVLDSRFRGNDRFLNDPFTLTPSP